MKSLALCALFALLAFPVLGVEPWASHSSPEHLVTFRGAILFFADDGIAGRQLWRSDGTPAGTFPLSEAPGELPLPVTYLQTEGLYFFLSSNHFDSLPSLWVSDGTGAGTLRLTGPDVGVAGGERIWIASQGVLFFLAQDPEHGAELWRTDGTPAGTGLVADVRAGPESSFVQGLTEYRGQAWFSASDGQRGGALWRSDGTAAGTVLAVDPAPSSASHRAPQHIRVVGNHLAFLALPPGGRSRNPQLWAGDGTARGTKPITSLYGGRGSIVTDPFVVHGGQLYFAVQTGRSQQLWISDGTARGTRALVSLPGKELYFDLQSSRGLGGLLAFRGFDPVRGGELWVTDGTPRGTRVLDLCPGPCQSYPVLEKVLAGRLYFNAEEPSHGRELWSSDGTPRGTRRETDVCPGSCSSFPYEVFALDGRILFVAQDGRTGDEIWSTDGTEEGTVRVTDFAFPYLFWGLNGFQGAVLDGQLLFSANDSLHGIELWRTDGTAAGTWLVEDINQ